ncbi:hypothetical protein [Pseudomonas nicosulfuronedens]
MAKSAKKALSEKDTRALEAKIPEKASLATKQAYQKAKSSGKTVLRSKDGFIVAEQPDGTERIVSPSKPRRKVTAGVSMKIGSGDATGART